ncbi:MAG: hypothetical protein JNL80_00485 [Phycisphaerae bacterium]|jgi:hypothetical protein|nr:hypothetical protein [Phycisphaerae bacterium]
MARGDHRPLFRTRAPTRLRAWLLTLATLIGLSLLPTRWLAGWTADVAGFANVILTPSKHALTSVRHWLRPPPDIFAGAPEKLRELELRNEEAIKRYRQLEIERDGLQERIAMLERAKRWPAAGDLTRLRAGTVIGVTRPSARSAGALQLNIGAMHGVLPGMVASIEGEIFVGRVAETVQRFSASVIPSTGLSGFAVRFSPPGSPFAQATNDAAPRGVLTVKDDVWTVDLSQPGAIAVGWVACVAEDRWPRSALGLRVGVVESVSVRDDAPLMRRITVRSFVDPLRVERVVLADDADPATVERSIDAAREAQP